MSIKLFLVLPLILITIGISQLKDEHSAQLHKVAQAKQTSYKSVEPTSQPATPVPTPIPTPVPTIVPAPPGTCRAAIAATWPPNLQQGALTVLVNENRSQNPLSIGRPNKDPWHSQDFGCFQINNHWHPDFFATQDWRDPYANARYAYQHIYVSRGNWSAWYAVQGILW